MVGKDKFTLRAIRLTIMNLSENKYPLRVYSYWTDGDMKQEVL